MSKDMWAWTLKIDGENVLVEHSEVFADVVDRLMELELTSMADEEVVIRISKTNFTWVNKETVDV